MTTLASKHYSAQGRTRKQRPHNAWKVRSKICGQQVSVQLEEDGGCSGGMETRGLCSLATTQHQSEARERANVLTL